MFRKKQTQKKDTDEIFNIPPYLIKPNPELSRTEFADMSLCSLADSIKRYGILQPLAVRLSEKGGYELVAGERRLRAAVMLRLSTVPCILMKEQAEYEYLSVIENIQREKLGMFDEARAVRRLLARNGGSYIKTAELLSLSEREVRDKVRLCEYSRSEMQALIHLGISRKAAVMLLDIPVSVRFYAIQLYAEKGFNEELLLRLLKKLSGKGDICCEELLAAAESIVSQKASAKEETKKGTENEKDEEKTRILLRDLRPFESTLEKSVAILNTAKYRASLEISENGTERIYTVTVSKDAERQP